MKKIKIIAIITAVAAAFANTAAYANETWQDWPHVGAYLGSLYGEMIENYNYFYPPKEDGIYISGDDWELPIDYTKYDEYDICFDKELQAVTDYYGDGGDVEIPSEIDGVPVKSIYGGGKFDVDFYHTDYVDAESVVLREFGAFMNNENILRVTLPNTVTSIESCAFYNASNLESINIPDGVTNIGAMAFYGTALKAIDLPPNLEIIPAGAFMETDIKNIRIPDSVRKIDGTMHITMTQYNYVTDAPGYSNSRGTDIGAFTHCYSLEKVLIGDNTKSIGRYAFVGCNALKNILIPESVTEIDDDAIYLKSATIYTTEGSYADTFAQEKGFNVRYYDKETKDNEGYDLLDIAVESSGEDEAAKSFTLTCNIRNNFVMEDTPVGTLVTAFYDENGCMVDAVIDDEYLNGLADTSWLDVSQYSRTINTDKNVSYAKAFIWEDSQSMVPLDEAVSSEAA